jgi:hypothetical protein
MKYIIIIIGLVVSLFAYSQNENYVEKVKLANEFKANSTAADAQDLSILANAANDWFYSKSFNNYLRVGTNDIRYEIPISTLKADGFLKPNWAKRFGSTETTVLNHPYVVSVTRRVDPNGSVLTRYSNPNTKYRFDMATYLDQPGGVALPPRPIKNPVYIAYYRQYPGYAGYMTKFMNMDRMSANGNPTDDISQMIFATSFINASDVNNIMNSNFGSGASGRNALATTMMNRFPSELSINEKSIITNEVYPTYTCQRPNIGTDAQLETFLNRSDVVGQLDGYYEHGDYAFLCRALIDPWFQVKSRKYYCSGIAKVNDGLDTIYSDISGYASSGMGVLGEIKSSQYYGTPQSDWACAVVNGRLISCDNSAAVNCTTSPPPLPDPCLGANPPGYCVVGGGNCEMYKKDAGGKAIWTKLEKSYPTTCDGSINGTTVLDLAVTDSQGRCVIYAPDTTKILCEEYLSLFWDLNKDGAKDGGPGASPFYNYDLLINATDVNAVTDAQNKFNANIVNPADKAADCTTQPANTTKPHESLCQKLVLPPVSVIEKLIINENYFSTRTCADPNSPACLPELIDRQCVYEINPWRGDSWPMVNGTEAGSLSAGCGYSSDGTIVRCFRSMKVASIPSCGLVGSSKTINWIDAPYNTAILISN